MKLLIELVHRGGPVMFAILALSVVLYSRCAKLLLSIRRSSRQCDLDGPARASQLPQLRRTGARNLVGARSYRIRARRHDPGAPLCPHREPQPAQVPAEAQPDRAERLA